MELHGPSMIRKARSGRASMRRAARVTQRVPLESAQPNPRPATMTTRDTTRGRFQRAIATRNLVNAERAAREMGGLSARRCPCAMRAPRRNRSEAFRACCAALASRFH
jgi:hypothetical protein